MNQIDRIKKNTIDLNQKQYINRIKKNTPATVVQTPESKKIQPSVTPFGESKKTGW